MKTVKSTGATLTERLLARLCERSFLKLWSYPSPFKEDGKELCDLLVVFENRVLIFFDRESRKLDNEDVSLEIRWNRWRKSVVDDQIRTARGAERYIRSGRKIFLDSTLNAPFPLDIPSDTLIVHKIIVAHGAEEACRLSSDDNIYGSLAVHYGNAEDLNGMPPFTLGLERNNPVHVLDSHNLPILLQELDTIADFSAYLEAKESAIAQFSLSYCGEEDLLAHYFLNFDRKNNRHYIGSLKQGFDHVMIGEGEWKDFASGDIYKRRRESDAVSYFWDELIQKTCQNALDGRLLRHLGNEDVFRGPSAVLEMAKEPRFVRRTLAEHIVEAVRKFTMHTSPLARHVAFLSSFDTSKGYVFLQLRADSIDADYEQYHRVRQSMLEVACGAARNRFDHLRTIVGIAVDAPGSKHDRGSEDLLYMDCSEWTDEQRTEYEDANSTLGFFTSESLDVKPKRIVEFPLAIDGRRRVERTKVGRNDPCPCGSGRKYKKCCLQ